MNRTHVLRSYTLDQLGLFIQGELATRSTGYEVPRTFVRGSIMMLEEYFMRYPKMIRPDDVHLLDTLKKAMEL